MATRVNLVHSAGPDSYDEIVEMETIPREGESICFSEDGPVLEIRSVTWIIGNPNYAVRIKFR